MGASRPAPPPAVQVEPRLLAPPWLCTAAKVGAFAQRRALDALLCAAAALRQHPVLLPVAAPLHGQGGARRQASEEDISWLDELLRRRSGLAQSSRAHTGTSQARLRERLADTKHLVRSTTRRLVKMGHSRPLLLRCEMVDSDSWWPVDSPFHLRSLPPPAPSRAPPLPPVLSQPGAPPEQFTSFWAASSVQSTPRSASKNPFAEDEPLSPAEAAQGVLQAIRSAQVLARAPPGPSLLQRAGSGKTGPLQPPVRAHAAAARALAHAKAAVRDATCAAEKASRLGWKLRVADTSEEEAEEASESSDSD